MPLALSRVPHFRQTGYRYAYAPAALLALERAIGEDAMRRTLRELLTANEAERNLATFHWLLEVAARAGASPQALDAWLFRCSAAADPLEAC